MIVCEANVGYMYYSILFYFYIYSDICVVFVCFRADNFTDQEIDVSYTVFTPFQSHVLE